MERFTLNSDCMERVRLYASNTPANPTLGTICNCILWKSAHTIVSPVYFDFKTGGALDPLPYVFYDLRYTACSLPKAFHANDADKRNN